MSEISENEALIAAIRDAAPIEQRFAHAGLTATDEPEDIDGLPIRIVVASDGSSRPEVFDDLIKAIDARADGPQRRDGTATLLELDSLCEYVNRYKTGDTIAWANASDFRVVVVFDDHPKNDGDGEDIFASWRKHRAMYTCPRSAEWQAWCAFDGKPLSQSDFADFIESRLEDLRHAAEFPKPLDVLQMARHLTIRSKGTFERQINPTTGEGILVNKTENEAGSTPIPRAFIIGIPVFEGGEPYQVEARVRFVIVDGKASFSYTLHRRKEIERDAFSGVRAEIAAETGVLLLAGQP